LVQTDDPSAGQMTLIFERGPIQLAAWSVIDAENQTTRVILEDLTYDIPLDDDLFRLPN
jgi:outer membrane lipoprotein-sorting protein